MILETSSLLLDWTKCADVQNIISGEQDEQIETDSSSKQVQNKFKTCLPKKPELKLSLQFKDIPKINPLG